MEHNDVLGINPNTIGFFALSEELGKIKFISLCTPNLRRRLVGAWRRLPAVSDLMQFYNL